MPHPKKTRPPTPTRKPPPTSNRASSQPSASPTKTKSPAGEKLQKVLARAGFGARRAMEQWIVDGRVSVDGRIASLGERVSATQTVRIDGEPLAQAMTLPSRRRVLVYHKPEGELCTRSDPKGRPTVFEHLPVLRNGRWVIIGRLDINTSGLLLFTNDGELANRLMHPSSEIEREYAVRVLGPVDQAALAKLLSGVELDDGRAAFDDIVDAGGAGANHWYHVILKEGRYREVRRLWEAVGATVSRLIRVRYADIALPRMLREGRWEELDRAAVATLAARVGIEEAPAPRSTRNRKTPGRPGSARRGGDQHDLRRAARPVYRDAAKPAFKNTGRPAASKGALRPAKAPGKKYSPRRATKPQR